MLDKIIFYAFAAVFLLTPLFWTPLNYELFEFNKMFLIYFLTVVITAAWLLKAITDKRLIVKRTPLDIPILLFLGANILSTIFSIDPHTSFWGYYSRLNGGLLSIFAYTLLFFAFTANINKQQIIKLVKFALLGGVIVSLYAIPEHFGVSPSCVILRGEFSAACWVQNVSERVFATLGQPNWMAAYLAMLIFPAFYFLLTATKKLETGTWYLVLIAYYLAFTFTYSRAGFLGLLAGMGVLLSFYFIQNAHKTSKSVRHTNVLIIWVLLSFLVVNLIFGSALGRLPVSQLLSKPITPATSGLPAGGPPAIPSGTQLEKEGSETARIRLIVWGGAWEIFKRYPILGSGVETFAYSYYQFRPAEHNLTTEWDFLYNKAHNEYLNYLANTGIVGLGAYSIIIITFIAVIFRKPDFFSLSLLASYISYLVQNFFGFSVVIISIFFYLFPALAFIVSDSVKPLALPGKFILNSIYRRPVYTQATKLFLILLVFYLLFTTGRYWLADTIYSSGTKQNEQGNPGRAYNFLSTAVTLNPYEPLYQSELSFAAASSALALKEEDATLSARLEDEAVSLSEEVLSKNPKNSQFFRTAIRVYYQLAGLDEKYNGKTLGMIDQTILLAPTDPKLYYNKAVILGSIDKNEEAKATLLKAIQLKPDYKEATVALSLFYFDEKRYEEAVAELKKVWQFSPNDPEILDYLTQWGKQGIATQPGEKL